MGILFKGDSRGYLGGLVYFEQSYCISCYYENADLQVVQPPLVPPALVLARMQGVGDRKVGGGGGGGCPTGKMLHAPVPVLWPHAAWGL